MLVTGDDGIIRLRGTWPRSENTSRSVPTASCSPSSSPKDNEAPEVRALAGISGGSGWKPEDVGLSVALLDLLPVVVCSYTSSANLSIKACFSPVARFPLIIAILANPN